MNKFNTVFMLSFLAAVVVSCEYQDVDGKEGGSFSTEASEDQENSSFDTVDTGSEIADTSSTEEDPSDEEQQGTEQDTGPPEEPTILDSSHSGWKLPGCWSNSCHSKKNTHNSQQFPHNCTKCHGKNGAEKREPPHFACIGCHSPIKNHSPVTDFSNLATCARCHG